MYNPKIYIRDYGSPDHRLLAFAGGYEFDFTDADLKRALIIHAENPVIGEEFLLLSGDQQSGADLLDLSGVGNDLLVLTNPVAMRWFGSDVALQYSNVSAFPSWAYELVLNDADLRRALIMVTEGAAFGWEGQAADLQRGLVVSGAGISYAVSTFAADFKLGNIIPAAPAAFEFASSDAGLLRSLPMVAATAAYAWSVSDANLARALVIGATGASFNLTFNDANISTDSILELSGDQQSGGDLMLLSGDQSDGDDFLLLSQ